MQKLRPRFERKLKRINVSERRKRRGKKLSGLVSLYQSHPLRLQFLRLVSFCSLVYYVLPRPHITKLLHLLSATAPAAASKDYKETRLQIRLASGGQPYVTTLSSESSEFSFLLSLFSRRISIPNLLCLDIPDSVALQRPEFSGWGYMIVTCSLVTGFYHSKFIPTPFPNFKPDFIWILLVRLIDTRLTHLVSYINNSKLEITSLVVSPSTPLLFMFCGSHRSSAHFHFLSISDRM